MKSKSPQIASPKIWVTVWHQGLSVSFEATIDTGAEVSTLTQDLAEKLGLKTNQDGAGIITADGRKAETFRANVDAFELAGKRNFRVPIEIVKAAPACLIGTDLIAQVGLIFDAGGFTFGDHRFPHKVRQTDVATKNAAQLILARLKRERAKKRKAA